MSTSAVVVEPHETHAVRAPLHAGQSTMPTALLGMLLFIASEVMFFGGLFATYFNARASAAGEWGPPAGAHELDIVLAGVLTVVLVTSSFTMQFGVWAIRRGNIGQLRLWTALTLILGVTFLLGQLYDYSTLGFGLADGVFGTTFYTLTGFHGAHVFGGTVGLTILLARAMRGQFSARNHVAVEAISIYWHFVDVVWIAVFSTIYLLR
ncbi:MAG: cytochrome c oxidase subunit 3 [Chloroflexi bacterium]|nr:cytochrome c oxidase subunit 3 [Chloroflexota bacterium]